MSNYRTLQKKVRALRELGMETPALNSKAEVLAQFLESVVSETTETEERVLEETSVNTEVDMDSDIDSDIGIGMGTRTPNPMSLGSIHGHLFTSREIGDGMYRKPTGIPDNRDQLETSVNT